jgi:hypothetical protein
MMWQDNSVMPVRSLSFVSYQENGWDWQLEKVANDEDDDVLVNCLRIMGRSGAYWIGLSAGKYEQLRLFNPDKAHDQVAVWTSDQGFADDFANYFGEAGEPLPDAPWERQ